jgi:hypothetical protein
MNPALAMKAAEGAKKVLSNKYVVIILVLIAAIFVLKGGIKKVANYIREKRFDKNETKDTNQLAQQYRAASNPSGVAWLIDMDGTDEDQIEKLAYQTKGNFKPIADTYRLKFDETLTDRMRKELGAEDFQDWHNIVT